MYQVSKKDFLFSVFIVTSTISNNLCLPVIIQSALVSCSLKIGHEELKISDN